MFRAIIIGGITCIEPGFGQPVGDTALWPVIILYVSASPSFLERDSWNEIGLLHGLLLD